MPIYEFECADCHWPSEILVSASRLPECPHCGSRRLTKQFSTFATSGGNGGGGHVHSASCGCGHGHSSGPSSGHCCGGHCHHAA